MISTEEQSNLAVAISEAESDTEGEIVLVVARHADDYRHLTTLWALLAALFVPWPLIWFTPMSGAMIYLVQALTALSLCVLFAMPAIRLAIVPPLAKRSRAHAAARQQFMAHGLTRTRHRSGVLIYVAEAERYAEILVDTGIADRVGQDVWERIVDTLIEAIKDDEAAAGLAKTVRDVGTVLALHAPARVDDVDELPNKVILI